MSLAIACLQTTTGQNFSKNGNSIQLPLEGYTNCGGVFQERFWNQGRYWSSTASSLSYGYCCMFDATGYMSLYPMEMCDGMSIRLIHKK